MKESRNPCTVLFSMLAENAKKSNPLASPPMQAFYRFSDFRQDSVDIHKRSCCFT
jgi:hypothetical protein